MTRAQWFLYTIIALAAVSLAAALVLPGCAPCCGMTREECADLQAGARTARMVYSSTGTINDGRGGPE